MGDGSGHVESTVVLQAGLPPVPICCVWWQSRYFKKLIQAYREIGREAGHADKDLVSAHSWGWIAEWRAGVSIRPSSSELEPCEKVF